MLTAIGVFASCGVAAAACTTQSTSKPFSEWGDTNSYFLASGGDFEGGLLTDWAPVAAGLTAGNEPFYVHSTSDRTSVTLLGGGSVISPPFCVDSTMPYFRFFAHQSARGSDLKVTLVLLNGTDVLGSQTPTVADLADGSTPTWAPTAPLKLTYGLAVPPGQTLTAELLIQAGIGLGRWQIDDVYVDPYRTG
jgi:hypothetical protein